MKDKVFGEIAYANNAWRKKMGLSLDGHDYEIELRIEDNNKEGILDIQREAFNAYQKNLDRYTQEVPNILVDHYKWYFEAIRKAVTLDEDTQKETITTQTMLDIVMATYFFDEIPNALMTYYLENYDEIGSWYDIPTKYDRQNITKDSLMDLITFHRLYFNKDGERYGWLCGCPWDTVHGLGIILSGDEIEIGWKDDLFD